MTQGLRAALFDHTVSRRVLGTALAILVVALGRVGIDLANRNPGAYEVTVLLRDAAGAGLGAGSDVKLRGVRIGSVVDLTLTDEADALATLELLPEPAVPAAVEPVVTAKTLLGEKQVELRIDGPLQPPFLQAGDRIAVAEGGEPVELGAVIAALEEVFSDIDERRLAALIEAFGSFTEADAQVVRRNIEIGEQLSDFGRRTAGEQVERLAAFADLMESLSDRGDDLNRMNRSLPFAVGTFADHEAEILASADVLSSFAVGFAEFLEEEEPTIARLFDLSDAIGASIDPRVDEIGRMVYGIYRYALVFGQHGGSLDDGTEHAWFKAFIGEEGTFNQICEGLPAELEQAAPGCTPDDIDDGSGDPG
ncbi:MAG: MlaD family protein [Nitriliruptorales bacterium]|nr:MlaD family protein [Nitriliruptorales bacterium]